MISASAGAATADSASTIAPPKGAGRVLLLLEQFGTRLEVDARELLLVLPPCRGTPQRGVPSDGWALGLTLGGSLRLDSSACGYERLMLQLSPRLDGAPLAPLEEEPPSWLQPARPLCAPSSVMLAPTSIELQYAAHCATRDGTTIVERLLDVHAGDLRLKA